MAQLRLTKTVIDRLEHPAAGQVLYYDTALRGFGVRIGRDSKSYFAEKRLNGRSVRITIGRHGIFASRRPAPGIGSSGAVALSARISSPRGWPPS